MALRVISSRVGCRDAAGAVDSGSIWLWAKGRTPVADDACMASLLSTIA